MDEQDFRADIIDALNCYKKASEQNPQATLAALCQKHARESKVSAAVHPKDYIFQYVLKHPGFPNIDEAVKYYFDDGRRSADMLKATLQNDLSIDVAKRKTMLEFASGYGAVTRHLRAVLPMFDITSSDIHQAANDFIVTMLGEKAIQSSTVPELFDARGEYDLVFALSFFSNMPKETWRRWLTALYKPLCVGGHLIFTTHGAKTLSGMPVDVVLDDDGFCFRPESEQNDLETSEMGIYVTQVDAGYPNILWFQKSGGAEHLTSDL